MGDFARLVTARIIGTRAVVLLAGLGVAASACDSSTVTATEARGRIAFLATEGNATELRVVDLPSGVCSLAVGADDVNPPHWSPDGSQIVFVGRQDGRAGLMLARTDGARWQTEWLEKRSGWHPAFSPDGRSIAFSSDREGASNIYIMDLETRVVRRLTDDGPAREPTWSPDGRRIAFVSGPGTGAAPQALWVIGADGSERRKLADHAASPRWSPSGRQIAIVAAGPALAVVDAESAAVRRIAHPAGDVAWSRDGTRLAFLASGGKPLQVMTVAVDGTELTDLTHNDRFNGHPAWSNDGNWIAFVSGGCQSPVLPCSETNHEVYVMRKDGSDAVKLTRGVPWATFPEWSPQGSER